MASNTQHIQPRQKSLSCPAENGSILAIWVANPGMHLYCHPLEWQGEHLELLRCELQSSPLFHGLETGDKTTQTEVIQITSLVKWNDIIGLATQLKQSRDMEERKNYIRKIFEQLFEVGSGLSTEGGVLSLHVNFYVAAKVYMPLMFCNEQADQRYVWAYIDGGSCKRQRYNYYRRKREYEQVMERMRDVKSLPLDPLYAAIIIALAQKARGRGGTSNSNGPLKVSLFVPKYKEDGPSCSPYVFIPSLKQYTAIVSEEFLKKFDYPYQFFDSTLEIHQVSWTMDQLPALFRAVQDASGFQGPEKASVPSRSSASKKRKVSGGVTGEAPKEQRRVLRSATRGKR